jgi:hypothetical protein
MICSEIRIEISIERIGSAARPRPATAAIQPERMMREPPGA